MKEFVSHGFMDSTVELTIISVDFTNGQTRSRAVHMTNSGTKSFRVTNFRENGELLSTLWSAYSYTVTPSASEKFTLTYEVTDLSSSIIYWVEAEGYSD